MIAALEALRFWLLVGIGVFLALGVALLIALGYLVERMMEGE